MPITRSEAFALVATTTPIVDASSTEEQGGEFDHLCLFVDFTLGSLTSLDITLEFSLDGSTWKTAYAADKTAISVQFTADFDGAIYLGVGSAGATRMQPAMVTAPAWRLDLNATGTNTSSSIKIDGIPFVMGAMRD